MRMLRVGDIRCLTNGESLFDHLDGYLAVYSYKVTTIREPRVEAVSMYHSDVVYWYRIDWFETNSTVVPKVLILLFFPDE